MDEYVNERCFIDLLITETGLSREACEKMIYSVVNLITETASRGRVKVPALGTFTSSLKRTNYWNPNTRIQETSVKPKVVFKPSEPFYSRVMKNQELPKSNDTC